VKISVAAVQALRKKETQETQFTTKIGGQISFGSQLFHFVKFSFPLKKFDALLWRNLAFLAPLIA
jgi:hypothetical protein